MNKLFRKTIFIAILVAMSSFWGMTAFAEDAPAPRPQYTRYNADAKDPAGVITNGSYVSFGLYPQSQLSSVSGKVENVDYITYNGKYFALEPVIWKVVSSPNASGQVSLVSEKILDASDFSSAQNKNAWSTSTVQKILTGVGSTNEKNEFLSQINFSAANHDALVPQKISTVGTVGKEALSRAFLLSSEQLTSYGFITGSSRQAAVTAYAAEILGSSVGSNESYWTRNADQANPTTRVVAISSAGAPVALPSVNVSGVRPAVVLDLSRVSLSTTDEGAGTISSPYAIDGTSSPHGGFTTTTNKCVTCHSAHGAAGSGELLLASKAADACTYCHVDSSSAHSSLQVYGGQVQNYTAADDHGHSSLVLGGVQMGVSCIDCHAVHSPVSALTGNAYLDTKILRKPAESQLGFVEYQNNPIETTDSKDSAMSKWCVQCHPSAADGMGHVSAEKTAHAPFSSTIANYSGQVAWNDSNNCISCHGAGYGTSSWPHYVSTSSKFLLSGASATSATTGAGTSNGDGVCLRCHRGTPTTGVGVDF